MNQTTDDRPILEIESLSVSFPNSKGGGGRLQAVDRVSLSVFGQQTLAIVGESGSGKSVTALSILQLVPVPPGRYDGGRIVLAQDSSGPPIDLLRQTDKQMRRVRGDQVAMIFQEPMTSLNPVYSIGEQIVEAILLHQKVNRNQAIEIAAGALAEVGIAEPALRLHEYPHQLSGGMRQRVMIAMALVCQPDLLLADEPTTALDVTIQAQILDLLRKLQIDRHMSVLLITHDLGVVAENADVVAVMFAGRLLEYGSVFEVFRRPLHPYTRGLLKSMPILGQEADRLPTVMDGATIPEDFPAGFTVRPHDPDARPSGPTVSYGGPDSHLYEVEPAHWVLCTPTQANATARSTPPRVPFRREMAARP